MSQSQILNAATICSMDMHGMKLVEASAGTGKTYTIANLYLKMVLDGRKVQDILVVTFTNAATEELRGRIRSRIYAALQYLKSPKDADELLDIWQQSTSAEAQEQSKLQLRLALAHMDDAAIYTIHAFCQKILTDQAFLTRQAFDVTMLTDDSAIWEAALKDWWRQTIASMDKTAYQSFANIIPDLNTLIAWQKDLRKPNIILSPKPKDLTSALSTIVTQWQKLSDDIQAFLLSDATNKKSYPVASVTTWFDAWDKAWAHPQPYFPDHLEKLCLSHIESKGLKKGASVPANLRTFFQDIEPLTHWKTIIKTNYLHAAHDFARQKVADIKQQSAQLAFDDQLVHVYQAAQASPELCAAIRSDFPIALVDEFQDTDAIQYGIFREVYQGHDDVGLMMIGDPKQAIYSFRGGDIFTYMQAKKDADTQYTLDTNWRSTHGMIAAINTIFSLHEQPFLYDAIPFEAVQRPKEDKPTLNTPNGSAKACSLWQIPLADNGKPIGDKNKAAELMHPYVANEIAQLLQQSAQGELHLGDKPVQAGDIAILVRGHQEALGVRKALQERGIASVSAGKTSVYESDEAQGLYLLLQAIIHHGDARIVRQALASCLLDLSYISIHQEIHTEAIWVQYLEKFRILHELWAKCGFISMFHTMLQYFDIASQLAQQVQGDRACTNLLHLSELLQQASSTHSSMDALLRWFEEHLNRDSQEDEAQLRLENDQNLVQISTIHAAKGLEYPIVFVPYLWSCSTPQKGKLSYYDTDSHQRHLTFFADSEAQQQAEKERLAEDMRLLYVALTRAKQKLYLACGLAGSTAHQSALAYLIHQNDGAKLEAAQVTQDLQNLAQAEHIEHIQLENTPPKAIHISVASQDTAPIHLSTCAHVPSVGRSISSFTRISQHVTHSNNHAEEQTSDDDAIMQFPAGRHTGLLLHSIMEQVDFQGNIPRQVEAWMEQHAKHHGYLSEEQCAIIPAWMEQVIQTPLHDEFSLSDISQAQRLNELHFDFSMQHLSIPKLNKVLQDNSPIPLKELQAKDCHGYMTGEIDMVFEHDGRFYLVDYKSNHLGNRLEDYAPESLQDAIHKQRYDVQYCIYSVALHRYLSMRMRDYDYEQHFGGVYYLFLRGMRPQHQTQYGVFQHKPSYTLIQQLSNDVFHHQPATI